MRSLLIFLFVTLILLSFKTDKPAYLIYDAKNQPTSWNNLVKEASKADVVLFGELHDNPVCHWLQVELAKHLIANNSRKLIMGAEMFESDQQLLLDEFLSGTITVRNFTEQARLWPNHKTDYAPLLRLAAEEDIRFIATNIPRRYASLVHRSGFEVLESLSEQARSYIAPLPVTYDPELPGYKAMNKMMGGMEHANFHLPKAQAIKDATMAHFILKNLSENTTFLHFHGTYHSNNYEGIYWYLKQANPELKILTIASVVTPEINKPDDNQQGLADFVLYIPESMTRTH